LIDLADTPLEASASVLKASTAPPARTDDSVMDHPNFEQLRITSSEISHLLEAERHDQAVELASRRLVTVLSDAGVAELLAGRIKSGIKKLQDALNVCPQSETAFHNLAGALIGHRLLKGDSLSAIQNHLARHWNTLEWTRKYKKLLFMPRFLNLEFVGGKCNLNCRMCLGTNRDAHESRLTYVTAEEFEKRLSVAPTAHALTLSAGDSDPLMHPEFDRIIEIAQNHTVSMDMFTNGHLLTAKICRKMIEARVINMINFSIDAATPGTYRKVRGASLERLIRKIEMLQAMKKEIESPRPWVSISFVAMADTIHELPDFIKLARRLGAGRVYVEDLHGWDDRPSDNLPATDNPQCFEYIRDARGLADEFKIILQLPERLKHDPAAAGDLPEADRHPPTNALACCGWIRGVWVSRNGNYQPCCLIADVAEMGNVDQGPILHNDAFAKVKSLLLEGKVFEACIDKRQCEYVQQQYAAGRPLQVITREELGDLARPAELVPLAAS